MILKELHKFIDIGVITITYKQVQRCVLNWFTICQK